MHGPTWTQKESLLVSLPLIPPLPPLPRPTQVHLYGNSSHSPRDTVLTYAQLQPMLQESFVYEEGVLPEVLTAQQVVWGAAGGTLWGGGGSGAVGGDTPP
jgi:hypothetical protein